MIRVATRHIVCQRGVVIAEDPAEKPAASLLSRITTGTKNLVGMVVGTVVKKKTSPPMKSQFSLGSHMAPQRPWNPPAAEAQTTSDWIGQKRLP